MRDASITDNGPWRSGSNRKEWFVESDDFKHDVRLTISGDFSSDNERWAYANMIAERLNHFGEANKKVEENGDWV